MTDTPRPSSWSLPPPLARQVDQVCSAFEAAWGRGERPRLEESLREVAAEARAVLLRELLLLELAYRRRLDERPTPDEYRARFPDDAALVADVFRRTSETSGASEGNTAAAETASRGGPASPPWPRVPNYEVLEELGRGGMGVVYKARQVGARRLVALKMIRDGALAGPEHRARFRIEAEAAARFLHPNLVRIYEVGEHDGLPFFSMELAEGGSLDRRLAAGPLPPREAAVLVRTVAEALQYAHDKQVVHRDLKPGNVVLAADGRPLITDFGLAKRLDSDTHVTGSQAVLGTASYMAPEQAEGKTREVGRAADIYSLGAILYELLAGRPPFRGDSWQATLRQVIHDEPVPPTRVRVDVPADLEAVCLHCLEKEPARRYATAQELADDLGRWLRGEPLSVAPVSEAEREARWAREAGFELEEVLTYAVRDVVYRARQVHLGNRLVALKIIAAPAEAEEPARQRLRHEARTLGLFDHPNIVRVYSTAELQGRYYLAFEYVAGGNLVERFLDQPQPPRAAADLVRQLAGAIHYAHLRGVLHCALKPSNVLLTDEGVPKIANFARSVLLQGEESERRLPFRRLPSYMAPELAEGRAADVGPATDVYALGAILYKLLTGGPPFLAESLAETLEQVLSQPPPPPSHLEPEVPSALEEICLKCLEKEPGRRYASANDLAEALAAFCDRRTTAVGEAAGVPGFKVLREVGRGSMSVVYEARRLADGRPVALKTMQQEFYYGRGLRQLLQEVARGVSGLTHPNVVPLYDWGEYEGRPYFVMEFLPGASLERRPSGRALPVVEAAALVRTLARTFDAVHRQGIVHGNLKPSKVLFTAEGTPKVTGFIIARHHQEAVRREAEAGTTMAGAAVMGTPRYMAPEQLSGNAAAVGPATDVYALGLILYELLTGWQPFRAATLWEMLAQVLREPPEPPSRHRPDLPPALDAACLRCLEKEPARRYPSAGALGDDLDHFLGGPAPAAPAPAPSLPRPASDGERPRPGGWARFVGWVTGRLGHPRGPFPR